MDAAGWVSGAIERYGVPLVMLAIVVIFGWRFLQTTLKELHAVYQERIEAIQADRDHYRERCEQGEDRVRDLARDLINELRTWRGENGRAERGSAGGGR